MAAITSLSDLVNLETNGSAQHYNMFMDNRVDSGAATVPVSAQFASLWRYNKTTGANGEFPPVSPGENPTRLTLGALRHNNASAGKELWLVGIEAIASTAGTLTLYDRLFHMRGLSGSVTGPQTVGGGITRNTSGIGNQIWLEIYSTIGATGTTVTASYTNQDGVAGKTTLATVFGSTGAREVDRIWRMPLADGDTGVISVETITLASSTGTAGDFGVTIANTLARVHCEGAATGGFRDLLGGMPSMVKIADDACLALLWHAGAPTAPRIDFSYHAVEK